MRNLSARVGVYMDVREREREGVGGGLDGRCVNGMRWMMMTTTQGGVGGVMRKGRGEKGFGIMRDGAIPMLSEVARPFDAKSEGFGIFNTMESFCTLWIDYSL